MKNIVLVFILLLTVAGCRKSGEDRISAVIEEDMATEDAGAAASMATPPVLAAGAAQTPAAEQKIIKNADIRFEARDLEETAAGILAAVKKHKGQVQHDSESKDSYSMNRNITVRVPAQSFESFIADISKGVPYFDRKEISSQDVTEEYIDLEARLKAKKVLEARYLELLKKANKVSEMLEIEKQLSVIREEIEAHEGRLRYMQNRVALSTVSIEFYKKTEFEGGATVSYGSKMGNALKSGFNALSTFFLGLLYIWPFILIFVIAFIIIRKKLRKRNIS